ncbi:NmrA-like family [Fragilaria crotonensis]|nr:NmrA-like family [Fragilaria crotonensis]
MHFDNDDSGSNNNKKRIQHNQSGHKKNKAGSSNSSNSKSKSIKSEPISKEAKKKIVAQAAKDLRKNSNVINQADDDNLLDIVNPFKAGKKLRNALESLTGISDSTKSIYLDDRIGMGMSLAERNPSVQRQSDYVPEVLVVGATGEVGRLVVRRLLLDGNVRVRVLVRDLYSKTLNLLGTGVTYCQGDLANYESLEYALTDVDKIVFCAGAPRQDETDFQLKFQQYTREILSSTDSNDMHDTSEPTESDLEWERMSSLLELRAKLAEQVDCIGMQNLVRAYQNVRFADYGALQTAKRSLFKFGSRNEDFHLFAIEDETMMMMMTSRIMSPATDLLSLTLANTVTKHSLKTTRTTSITIT